MKNKVFFFLLLFISLCISAQDIPQHISYTRIYDFLDELANDGYIELNSAIRPYSRQMIADKLVEAEEKSRSMGNRQRKELQFFLNEYALERDVFPTAIPNKWESRTAKIGLLQPAVYYKDNVFKARITPLLGMHITANKNDRIIQRWYGAEFQGTIGKHLTVWGSLRDNSFDGPLLSLVKKNKPSDVFFQNNYLTNLPGYEYKESGKGGDYSDSRGGIKYGWKWGSVGLAKDNVVWGDNYNGSNILSGRAPSFPMLMLNLKPAKWFELNYFHGWLVSNVTDSTNYYVENDGEKHYRPAKKYIAANMLTFRPVEKLNLSIGNAIIYSESNVEAAYFTPIAFYKSIDHTLTKGLGTENQNSAMFLNISSRNIKHVHLYASVFVDEFNFSRLKKSNKEANPISFKIGGKVTNPYIDNISLTAEYTRTSIITYKHSIPTLSWASNNYNLGHYLGDNAQEIFLAATYKPIRGLDLTLSYVNAKHGKEYEYIRRNNGDVHTGILAIISQPSLGPIIWTNQTIGFKALYEVFNNAYAVVNFEYTNIQGHGNDDEATFGERKMTAEETLKYFTPEFLWGKNTTFTVGFSFGF